MPRTKTVDLDAIDRLEEKVKRLVEMIGQLRAAQARLNDENARLERDLETARARLAEAEDASAEFTAMKEEREVIRTRVAEMLDQLETLSL
jgi:regulator of replication initiation timing